MAFVCDRGKPIYYDTGQCEAKYSLELVDSGETETRGTVDFERWSCAVPAKVLLHPFSLPHAGSLGLKKIGLQDQNCGFGIMTMVETQTGSKPRELPISTRQIWNPKGCNSPYSGFHLTGYNLPPTMLDLDSRLCKPTSSAFDPCIDRRAQDTFAFHWNKYAGCAESDISHDCHFVDAPGTDDGCILLVPYRPKFDSSDLSAFSYLINSKYSKERKPNYKHAPGVVKCGDILQPGQLCKNLYCGDDGGEWIMFQCKDSRKANDMNEQFNALKTGIHESCKKPFLADGAEIHFWRVKKGTNMPDPHVLLYVMRDEAFVDTRERAEVATSIGIEDEDSATTDAEQAKFQKVIRGVVESIRQEFFKSDAGKTPNSVDTSINDTKNKEEAKNH